MNLLDEKFYTSFNTDPYMWVMHNCRPTVTDVFITVHLAIGTIKRKSMKRYNHFTNINNRAGSYDLSKNSTSHAELRIFLRVVTASIIARVTARI